MYDILISSLVGAMVQFSKQWFLYKIAVWFLYKIANISLLYLFTASISNKNCL